MAAPSNTTSRNSPCPCGSGRRYKDCCGALGGEAGAAVGAASINSTASIGLTSPGRVDSAPSAGAVGPTISASPASPGSYRPAGADWKGIAEVEQGRLAALMEAALAAQLGDRLEEADRRYRAVLAAAPRTHDALHMLAMIRWRVGDHASASELIDAALALRGEYVALRQNRALIRASLAAHESRIREAECEKELPRTFESSRELREKPVSVGDGAPSEVRPRIVLIGAVDESDSDDAWMLRRIASLLAPYGPEILPVGHAVVASEGGSRNSPHGVHVLVGVDLLSDAWLRDLDSERIVIFAQSARPSRFLVTLRTIIGTNTCPVELVVPSDAKAARFGPGHHVLLPPIEIDVPVREFNASSRDPARRFIVGSVVQEGGVIPYARTDAFLADLAAATGELRLYDPGRVRSAVGANPSIRCYSRRDTSLAGFLAPLDCYLRLTREWWMEGSGRDLFGAMARGIPVLCPRTSIHAEYIDHEVDGLLYDDDDESIGFVLRLRGDPGLAASIGAAGRAKAQRLFDPQRLAVAYRQVIARPQADRSGSASPASAR